MTFIEILLILKCAYFCVHLIHIIFEYLTATDIMYDEYGKRIPGYYQYLEPLDRRLLKSLLCFYLMISDVMVTTSILRDWHQPYLVGLVVIYAAIITVTLFAMIVSVMDDNSKAYKFEHAQSLEELPKIHAPVRKVLKGTLLIFIFWFVQIMICAYYIG